MTDPNSSPENSTPKSATPRRGGLGSTLKVSALTLGSRFLGLVREQLFAALLGAGYFADAFVIAFRIPNLLRDLLAEGALSSAFVPTFAKVEAEQGKDAAHDAANRVLGALLMVVGVLTALGIVFAEQLAFALAAGFRTDPGKLELTGSLARIMMPFLLLVSLAAVLMGMLNARSRFSIPALAPTMFNLGAIVVGVGLWLAGVPPEKAVYGWALGTLAGGAMQFAIQLPAVRRDGFRLRPRFTGVWGDPAVRRVARLMAPAMLGMAATEVNIFVNSQFASTEPGANAWLNYAFRLMYLPIGVFGVAVATVTATNLAKRAAEKDLAGVRSGWSQGLKHVAFLTVPATVGLAVLAEPVIALIYEHGRFKATDTAHTALALMGYTIGLYAYSAVKVTAPAFYALDKTRIPLIGSASAVATNLLINVVAHGYLRPYGLGFVGLAVGTSLGALVNLAVLSVAFRKLTHDVAAPAGLGLQFVKTLVAALVMGAAVWGLLHGLGYVLPGRGTMVQLVRVLAGLGVGAAVYAVVCKLLRVGELEELLGALRRRTKRAG